MHILILFQQYIYVLLILGKLVNWLSHLWTLIHITPTYNNMDKLNYILLNQKLYALTQFYFEINLHYSFYSNKTTNVNLLNGLESFYL